MFSLTGGMFHILNLLAADHHIGDCIIQGLVILLHHMC